MPKLLNFKTKSIIYFQGDHISSFFILRRGSVVLTNDLSKKTDIVKPGNFFGTQASLIGKPQGDTAMATLPSEVLSFSYKEFIDLVQNNNTLLANMIQNFTGQLSGLYGHTLQLLDKIKEDEKDVNFETSLYRSATFFLKNRTYAQAKQSYAIYLRRFPHGEFASTAQEKLEYCTQRIGGSEDMSEKIYLTLSKQENRNTGELTDMQIEYEEVLTLITQKKHSQALLRLTKLLRMEGDSAYPTLMASCLYYLGETFIQMDKFKEAIEPLKTFTTDYPDHDDSKRANLYLAMAYEKCNKDDEARTIYMYLLDTLSTKSPMFVKVSQTLENLNKKK
jgi:CRP-like cAMP-binding protein